MKKPLSSGLRNFTKQYKRLCCEVEGTKYCYVHCPAPNFSFLEQAAWSPTADHIPAVKDFVAKHGLTKQLGYFYNSKEGKWYVIDHLWLAMLTCWGNAEMKRYIRSVLSTMISKAWDEEEPKKTEPTLFTDKLAIPEPEKKEEPKKEEKPSKLLDKVKAQVITEQHRQKFGITQETYDILVQDKDVIIHEFPQDGMDILMFHKYLRDKWGVKLADTMKVLKEKGIIYQDEKHPHYRINYELTIVALADGYGTNRTYENKKGDALMLPRLSLKGIFYIMYQLRDAGLVPKRVVPKLFS